MGFFDRKTPEPEPVLANNSDVAELFATQEPDGYDDDYRIIWGESCFAEYDATRDEDEYWSIQKYDSDWSFYLPREADVIELMKRLDARAKQVCLPYVFSAGGALPGPVQ